MIKSSDIKVYYLLLPIRGVLETGSKTFLLNVKIVINNFFYFFFYLISNVLHLDYYNATFQLKAECCNKNFRYLKEV